MRIVVETFYDENQNEIGELVIESDELSFKIVHYGDKFDDKGKRLSKDTRHYITEGGALRGLKRWKLKEGTYETIGELLQRFVELDRYIQEKTALVVAARMPKKAAKVKVVKPAEVPIESDPN